MKLFHRTNAADSIIENGFRDAEDFYMTVHKFRGVWFSDRPLDCNEGARGDAVLTLDVPDEVLEEWEWREQGKSIREFLIPADVVNRLGPPMIYVEQ